jgi:hypothetical protein
MRSKEDTVYKTSQLSHRVAISFAFLLAANLAIADHRLSRTSTVFFDRSGSTFVTETSEFTYDDFSRLREVRSVRTPFATGVAELLTDSYSYDATGRLREFAAAYPSNKSSATWEYGSTPNRAQLWTSDTGRSREVTLPAPYRQVSFTSTYAVDGVPLIRGKSVLLTVTESNVDGRSLRFVAHHFSDSLEVSQRVSTQDGLETLTFGDITANVRRDQ